MGPLHWVLIVQILALSMWLTVCGQILINVWHKAQLELKGKLFFMELQRERLKKEVDEHEKVHLNPHIDFETFKHPKK